ncbi:FAD-dependent monooxygenase [Mucilaginibacter sp. Bleaf8]|uniref:FAD-dependent oxidoreductase n=1 Tax=Mucilaginibacter sp. Bleaf8 TaxID=2834430 RepID=UPI001BD15B26|nr:NAD(P)/FAD-dependent oxidoreductase [Mucilaginibacter sp. Bleaf8]MBS7566423.1 FAD-dependent monooxygenase [Mucilaginibacter sp. Bleaf8]
MKNIQNKTIAIVGGGPAGLTLARLLQMQGADVKVYERDASRNARAQGATLDLHDESGLKALRAAGLMEAFKAHYRPGADMLRVVDQQANVIWEDQDKEEDDQTRLDAGDPWFRPEIDRGPLQTILLDSLQPETVVWNSHLLSIAANGTQWQLEFKNGNTVTADVVIAADGANSKVRPYITPIKPFFAGVTVVEGMVYDAEKNCPEIAALLKGGKIFAMGDSKTLIISSKGDGSLYFYAGCKTNENWVRESSIDFTDGKQVQAWFKQEFAGWHHLWLQLFANAVRFTPRPQYCMPLDQTWDALPNLTMIGDAAHLMPPYAGEGVNMAMLDALELSACLLSDAYPDLQSAIAAYEQQMRTRASEIAGITLESTKALHSPDAIPFLSRIVSGN